MYEPGTHLNETNDHIIVRSNMEKKEKENRLGAGDSPGQELDVKKM